MTGMKIRRRRRILGFTAAAFAATALAAPAAQAMPYNGQEGGTVSTTSQPVSATPTGGGFDWADAGIGVAAAASVVLVAGGGVLVVRGTRRSGLAGT
jgi:hypothetical protein